MKKTVRIPSLTFYHPEKKSYSPPIGLLLTWTFSPVTEILQPTAKMADGLQMGNLSINDSQHAPQGNGPPGRAAYIPPHLRGRPNMDGAAPPPGPAFDGPRYVIPELRLFFVCVH